MPEARVPEARCVLVGTTGIVGAVLERDKVAGGCMSVAMTAIVGAALSYV